MAAGTESAYAENRAAVWTHEHEHGGDDVAEHLVRVAVAIAGAVVGFQTAVFLVGELVLDGRLELLDADLDTSVWSWLSVGVTFACAFLLLALAVVGDERRLALAVAAPVAFLSADDMLRWHEQVSSAVDPYVPLSRGWPFAYLPLLAAVFLGVWRLADGSPEPARRVTRLGLLLLAAAVMLEFVSAALLEVVDDTSTWYTLQVALEEGAELAGWALVTSGLLVRLVAPAPRR